MIQTKADFNYHIININGEISVFIVDLDRGGVSVTNDIENVVAFIKEKENILDSNDPMIMYRDSTGRWDGWDGDFVSLGGKDEWEASRKFRLLKQNDTVYTVFFDDDSKCPECGHTLNAASYANGGKAIPKAGDFSICANCYAVNQFEKVDGSKLTVVPATKDALAEFKENEPDTYARLQELKQI